MVCLVNVGSLEADQFLTAMPRGMLVFISGLAVFVKKGLAKVLADTTHMVVVLDMANRVMATLRKVCFPTCVGCNWYIWRWEASPWLETELE